MALASLHAKARAASPIVTQYSYDAGDHVTQVIDPRGLVTTYQHDGLDQLLQQSSPDTGTTTFGYDSYGRETSMTRADLVQTTYGYDSLNRRTTVSAGGLTQTFAYDTCTNGIGRLCSDSDATGTTSYVYTPEGWVASRGFGMGGTSYAIGYSYDSVGHVAAVIYPDGNQATYAYASGAISGVTLKIGSATVNGATNVTYRPADLAMAGWTSSNGLVNTLSYDTDGRLTAIAAPGIQDLGLGYDGANRITRISNGIDSTMTQSIGYDEQSRLASVQSGADNETYQYDADGNRMGQTSGSNPTIGTISSTSNQLQGLWGNSYGYDVKGNMTVVNGATQYHYDAFNRMDSASGTAYYVNPEGQRLRKSGDAGTTYFAPDQGGSLLAENPNGAWMDYVWLNGRLIGRISGGQAYAIHDDQTGRPEAMTDASRAVVWRAQNFAFTQSVVIGTQTLNVGFPGQYYDVEASAWNNGYRDYKSGLGRYVESDPTGLSGGINTYTYAGNNPISNSDPYGLVTWNVGMLYAGYDFGAGLNVGYFQATAPCGKNGMMVVNGIVVAPGSDFGAKAGFVGFTTTLEDANPYAVANVFNGAFVTQGGGVVMGGGATYSAMRIGGASATYGWGAAGGLSEGFGVDIGFARVTSSYIIGKP